MSVHPFQPSVPLAADGEALSQVLQRARVGRSDLVRVVGPAGPTAMLWLARNGFSGAVYARAIGEGTRSEAADALLVPHACHRHELAALMGGAVAVREGGSLIVQTATRLPAEDPESVASLLRSRGFAIEQTVTGKGRSIYIARREGLGGFK